MVFDWANHRLHRQWAIRETGQWAGLCDAHCTPIYDLPPLIDGSFPWVRGSIESMELTMSILSPSGTVHPIVDEIIADGLSKVDSRGVLVPNDDVAQYIVVERPGLRYVYRVGAAKAKGQLRPSRLSLVGTELKDVIRGLVGFSYPGSITGEWVRIDRDYAAAWSKFYDVQHMAFGRRADGFTVAGPAVKAIHRVISDSLAATFRATKQEPHIFCPEPPGAVSPEVLIRPSDDNLWDTVIETAMLANVSVEPRLWWPGDTPVEGLPTDRPIVIIDVAQEVTPDGDA